MRDIFSKLLLFGEYAILRGGNALALPYQPLSGRLMLDPETEDSLLSHENIKKFAAYLEDQFYENFDFDLISRDISNGLYFESNIPQGYGVGSSGALIAAFLTAYNKNLPETPSERKNLFAEIENYFHGSSSGLDVLVCYENVPIFIENEQIEKIELNNSLFDKISLLDTGTTGLTSQMVERFKSQDQNFESRFAQEFIPAANSSIQYFLEGNEEALFAEMKKLSFFTFNHMPWTIPDSFKPQWKDSLESAQTALKLCGSGGGGFVIAFNK